MAWRPSASLAQLRLRAQLLAKTREFFDSRGLTEVDTPALVNHGVTDINLDSAEVRCGTRTGFLHTSPEYAMKRLLAAGSGDIYQLCHVVRGDESGRHHNPEFMLLEWYRVGWTMDVLIDEVAELFNAVAVAAGRSERALQRIRYRDAFHAHFGFDPIATPTEKLLQCSINNGLDVDTAASLSRDGLLDFLIGVALGPTLGKDQWVALTHYPASQAALAELDPQDPRVALRFEFYGNGIELANGFQELGHADQQRERFIADNAERRERGLPNRMLDEYLLAALEHGLPPSAGVAVGFDRLMMVATGAAHIRDVMTFTTEHA
jgi:lysyl-tRNA synthetase class 2